MLWTRAVDGLRLASNGCSRFGCGRAEVVFGLVLSLRAMSWTRAENGLGLDTGDDCGRFDEDVYKVHIFGETQYYNLNSVLSSFRLI